MDRRRGASDGSLANGRDADVAALYVDTCELLRRLAMRKFSLPEDVAETLVHDVFVSYLERSDEVRQPRAWLIGAVCNAARAHLRSAARFVPLPVEGLVAAGRDPIDSPTVDALLVQLPRSSAYVLYAKYICGFTAREISSELGTTEGYAEQLLVDARRRARRSAGHFPSAEK